MSRKKISLNSEEAKSYYETHNIDECCIKFGVSRMTFYKAIKALGAIKPVGRVSKVTLTDDIRNMIDKGYSVSMIAKSAGCKPHIIYSLLRRNNIKVRRGSRVQKDDFEAFYMNHTILDTAEYFSVSTRTVIKWAKVFNLPERRQSCHRKVNRPKNTTERIQRAKMIKYLSEKFCEEDIARLIGYDITSVSKIINDRY